MCRSRFFADRLQLSDNRNDIPCFPLRMLKRHWPLLIGLCGMYLPLTADSKAVTEAEFIRSAVIPLPERPPKDIDELIATLGPYQSAARSALGQTQTALWLRQLSLGDLQSLRGSIQSPWTGGNGWEAIMLGLLDTLNAAIAAKQVDSGFADQPLAAKEAGRRAAQVDFKAAIASASQINDERIRSSFLLGVAQTTGRAESLEVATELRNIIEPLLTGDDRAHAFDRFDNKAWISLWPGKSGTFEFSDSSKRPPVLGARDPEGFIKKWENQDDDAKRSIMESAIGPLLRRDPSLINRIIEKLPTGSAYTDEKIFKAWQIYDPASAIDWIISRNHGPERNISDLWRFSGADPKAVVDSINRHPEVARDRFTASEAGMSVANCFDPLKQRPEDFAAEILRISEPSIRGHATGVFAMQWGHYDGQAAFDFAQKIPDVSDREKWLYSVTDSWIRVAPDAAAAALRDSIDYSGEGRDRLLKELAQRRARKSEPAKLEPIRFSRERSFEALSFSPGGNTTPSHVRDLRKDLAAQAHPGEPPATNADLCREVVSLGNDTAAALFANVNSNPPRNAKENLLRQLLLERWVLSSPGEAASWIVQNGNQMDRESMALALSRLALIHHESAFELASLFPDENAFYWFRSLIVQTLATRSYREACEVAKEHGIVPSEVYGDWRRADPKAADEWLRPRWLSGY